MKSNQQQGNGWLALGLGVASVFCTYSAAQATVITFDSQTTANAPFTSEVDGIFTVTALGTGFNQTGVSTTSPLSGSIYLTPDASRDTEGLEVTDGGAAFDLISTDFASRSIGSNFTFIGYDGTTQVFDVMGPAKATNTFITSSNTASAIPVTEVLIELSPSAGTTAINVDNIVVSAVPEPMTNTLLGAGGVALAAFGWSRRRAV